MVNPYKTDNLCPKIEGSENKQSRNWQFINNL